MEAGERREPLPSLPIESLWRADGTYGLQHTMPASCTEGDNRDRTKLSQKATATCPAPAAAAFGGRSVFVTAFPAMLNITKSCVSKQ